MQLYVGSSKDFVAEVTRYAIAGKLEAAFFDYYRYRPSVQEVQSWQNSLLQMGNALSAGELLEQGIILEYQLPLTSRRLDCMVLGRDERKISNAVIVELKQWGDTESSEAEDCVVAYVGGRRRDVLHPSRQVGQYEQYLRDVHTTFASGEVGLRSCAYLHNFHFDGSNEIFGERHKDLLTYFPVFAGDQQKELINFVRTRVGTGDGERVVDIVLAGKYRPSKKLLEHTAEVIKRQPTYVLLDSQQVVFNRVLARVRAATTKPARKSIFLIQGGPGTGKSVIALHLVGALSGEKFSVLHVTGSKAFTENIRRVVGVRAAAQFSYTHFNMRGDVPFNQFDAVIVDEAHRVRSVSSTRFTASRYRTGKPQIDEIVEAAKVSIFFIDDLQVVRPGEVGSAQLVRDTAQRCGADLFEYELEAQFRCNGSEAFVAWIENTLSIQRTANILWRKDDPFEFRIFNSLVELEKAIRDKNETGRITARLTAGFCWPWSDPNPDGSLPSDIKVSAWSMPWNAKPEAGRLGTGIPKSNFWASDPRGLNQVGCIYTAQGFEFDYVGVVFGADLRYDWERNDWVGDPSKSADSKVKRSARISSAS